MKNGAKCLAFVVLFLSALEDALRRQSADVRPGAVAAALSRLGD